MDTTRVTGSLLTEKPLDSANTDGSAEEPLPVSDEEQKGLGQDRVDSGLLVWTQCVGSFCLFMATWGITNSFGKASSI